MNAAAFLAVSALFCAGTVTACVGIRNAFPPGAWRKCGEALLAWNERILQAGIEHGLFRFPGIRLVENARPLLFGELAGIGLLLLAPAFSRTTADLAGSVPLAAAAGSAVAYLLLGAESRRRMRLVREDLPGAALLLSLLLDAGQGPYSAIQELVRTLPDSPLRGRIHDLFRARSMGVPSSEAFERARSLVPMDEYRVFLNLIQQGERLGVGLSDGLRELSDRMLEARSRRAEAAAQKAAVKLLFPLIFFIFPAVFLIVLSPVILRLREMFGG